MPDLRLTHAWFSLTSRPGTVVSYVAAELGWFRQHLAKRLVAETGCTPRELQRLARFQRSVPLVSTVPQEEAAFRAGYHDQAHMLRDWHRLAGCTPNEWRTEKIPSVQAKDSASP